MHRTPKVLPQPPWEAVQRSKERHERQDIKKQCSPQQPACNASKGQGRDHRMKAEAMVNSWEATSQEAVIFFNQGLGYK